jgi:ATP synthase protein I
MVRAIFEGGVRPVLPGREHLAAMASDDANRPGPRRGKPSEAELSDRLRRLGDRLVPAVNRQAADATEEVASGADPTGLGKAMRLSSEFIAGVIAGAGLGWLVDRMLGTSPWGMIILMMLGFAAGLMNVLRAAGMIRRPSMEVKQSERGPPPRGS